jgi:hypothetical protein
MHSAADPEPAFSRTSAAPDYRRAYGKAKGVVEKLTFFV